MPPTPAPGSDAAFDEVIPSFDAAEAPQAESSLADTADEIPLAVPLDAPLSAKAVVPPGLANCLICGAARASEAEHCVECGWLFPTGGAVSPPSLAWQPGRRLADRYEVAALLPSRPGIHRYRVREAGAAGVDLILLASPAAPARGPNGEPILHALDEPQAHGGSTVVMRSEALPPLVAWPSVEWEGRLLALADTHGLPRLLDSFTADAHDCLVHEIPLGQPLWDAWDDPDVAPQEKYRWLADLAGTLAAMHQVGAIVESLRPDILRLGPDGKPRFVDLADFLPLPLPDHAQLQASLYSAPELVLQPLRTDARADLYGFGAMLYALLLGRELAEMDFERHGVPKAFVERFPDSHPLLARLMMKTFVRDLANRFPTEEAFLDDPTGFGELFATLNELGAQLMQVRIDAACWTSTGLVRSGNEDACALLQAASSRHEASGDRALALLTDGMGGCEAGEVASAMAIDTLRTELLREQPFAALMHVAPQEKPVSDPDSVLAKMKEAMATANLAIHVAARVPGSRHRGMGCTAEAVYIEGSSLYVAHVGDSRTYLLRQGLLRQVTRDQTLVARLVELGQLTEEEAALHPRRNELQQALGGHSSVEPLLYHLTLQAGDTVLVCSDGLTGMVDPETIAHLLRQGHSAEATARRLVNVGNLHGGADNITVIVLRLS